MHSCFGCQLKVLRALEGAGSFRADMRFVSPHDTGKEACCVDLKSANIQVTRMVSVLVTTHANVIVFGCCRCQQCQH